MNISDEAVEAAARAYFENEDWRLSWDFVKEPNRSAIRADQRAALEAAAPLLKEQAWNEGCAATTRAVGSGADYPVNPYKVVP